MIRFAAVLLASIAVAPAFGWNALGHKTIAEIAWRQLKPADRQAIVDTLRRHPRFDADFAAKMIDDPQASDKAAQDRWIFQSAAYWPDVARGLPKGERGKYDRPVWHYINFPLFLNPSDRTAIDLRNVNRATDYTLNEDPKKFNVLQAIGYCRATLKSKAGPNTKALAYSWLFHLVGDIHQPLHSTALFSANQFPKGDRGGNEIPLMRGKNLHSLWDNLLGRQHYMRNVDKVVVELSDRKRFGAAWKTAPGESDPLKWAQESHELCESMVYADEILDAVRTAPPEAKLEKIVLPETYYKSAGDHARRRIIAAGIRLGRMLATPIRN